MLENLRNFFKKIGKKEEEELLPSSSDAAKERLHLVLMQDRANVSIDFLDLMKQEIIDVIKKYIDIDENSMDVRLTNQINEDGTNGAPILYANIPIVAIKNEEKVEQDKTITNNEKKKIANKKEENVNNKEKANKEKTNKEKVNKEKVNKVEDETAATEKKTRAKKEKSTDSSDTKKTVKAASTASKKATTATTTKKKSVSRAATTKSKSKESE
ncbi:MAG: cell division topological specificity factor MinE [Clostridia bacterium]|nr:cell division topological specificity factor MinE [Clostridia bacterium]